ncbi:MAG: cell division protein FtsB [Cobetia sp.]|nr:MULTISPECIES: cell division protein FtsB [Cobetia]AVV35627.1 cell division protein FtsB [Halomonas sp. SF2003]MBR9755385.1 cell division protein FtsB [Gammaproteobacteria bacterium]MBS4153830.1 cell division protein FtsB [Cobetia sp. MC34]NHH85794.1 Cell division protein FtsB [Cobetia sp. MB87]QQK66012.1 cell division protein FtsB [Cobetia sp. cqz5-12]QWN38839.1 cell division protein FtsB [Cobetia sp. 4B]TCJ27786.1 cell division protein FtsB [Halomonas sp. GDM18]
MLKWINISLLLLLALLQYRLWWGENGITELFDIRARVQQLSKEDAVLDNRNQRLGAEVVDLKNGLAAIEERARNDLGMVRKDEQFLWVPNVAVPERKAPSPDEVADGALEGKGLEGGLPKVITP